jgi:hypothetical protein
MRFVVSLNSYNILKTSGRISRQIFFHAWDRLQANGEQARIYARLVKLLALTSCDVHPDHVRSETGTIVITEEYFFGFFQFLQSLLDSRLFAIYPIMLATNSK